MYQIEKIISDGIELLPDITDTPMWKEYEANPHCGKVVKQLVWIYTAISQRENYFQLNTPTAFGNPQYNYYCGLVNGNLQSAEMEEVNDTTKIIITRKNKKLLVIDKISRTQGYYDAVQENKKMINELGL